MLNAVAILIGQGEERPTDGTARLGRDAWELAKERLRIPKRLGGLGLTDATSKCPVRRFACVILIEIRLIKFNLTSRAYQTKSSF